MYFYDEEELVVSESKREGKELEVKYDFNEKHTPIVERKNGQILVKVNHGMSEEHYITTIVYKHADGYEVKKLKFTDNAEAIFTDKGSGVVYEHCNLHGIFAVDC